MFTRHAIGCLCCAAILLGGCESGAVHETWKTTRGLYYSYLNPPVGIDYGDVGNLNPSQARLANNMRPIDEELTRFERYMINQDKPPNPERVEALLERFRWLNGVVAVSPEGEVLAQEPSAGLKPLDFTAFAAAADPVHPRDLRGEVQMTPLGPEMLFGAPVFNGTELKGYYVAYFDIQALTDRAPDPAGMIIMSPQGVLWRGGPDPAEPAERAEPAEPGAGLAGADWRAITKSSIEGRMDGYYWICRYFGGVPLIFAAPETDEKVRIGATAAEPEPAEPGPAESDQTEPDQAKPGGAGEKPAQG